MRAATVPAGLALCMAALMAGGSAFPLAGAWWPLVLALAVVYAVLGVPLLRRGLADPQARADARPLMWGWRRRAPVGLAAAVLVGAPYGFIQFVAGGLAEMRGFPVHYGVTILAVLGLHLTVLLKIGLSKEEADAEVQAGSGTGAHPTEGPGTEAHTRWAPPLGRPVHPLGGVASGAGAGLFLVAVMLAGAHAQEGLSALAVGVGLTGGLLFFWGTMRDGDPQGDGRGATDLVTGRRSAWTAKRTVSFVGTVVVAMGVVLATGIATPWGEDGTDDIVRSCPAPGLVDGPVTTFEDTLPAQHGLMRSLGADPHTGPEQKASDEALALVVVLDWNPSGASTLEVTVERQIDGSWAPIGHAVLSPGDRLETDRHDLGTAYRLTVAASALLHDDVPYEALVTERVLDPDPCP